LNILLSNDDGVEAKGLAVLAKALSAVANVTVVAPEKNRSGTSSALTLHRPLRIRETERGFYAIDGTPCDCVHLGSHRVMSSPPDMVIAGINHGPNLGDDVLYSGTVAAAMEGRNMGFPAIAISLADFYGEHFATAAAFCVQIVKNLMQKPLPFNAILNINVPNLPENEIKAVRVTRLGHRYRSDTIVPSTDARGNPVYWIGPPSHPEFEGEGTDFHAIKNATISVTPLLTDLTAAGYINPLSEWLGEMD